ncbi:MAG: phage portal protein [Allorhizobium sp.]
MFKRIRELLSGTRNYQAAGGGRRGSSIQGMPAPLSSASAARGTLAARARFAVANDPLAAAGVTAIVTQTIGSGIVATSRHADKATREALNAAHAAWVDVADDEGRTDWFGLQANLYRSMVIAGEGLAPMLNTDDGLRIRVLDPEQLDASYSATLASGRIVQGIEFDASGRRVAYHIFDQPIGLDFTMHRTRLRIAAEDVIHVFRQDWPGQVRGLSAFAPALTRLSDLTGWRDAQLMRQRVSAAFAGFVVNPDGTAAPLEGEQTGSTILGGLEPGTIQYLEPGQDIRFSDPAQIGADVVDFASTAERECAIALGLPAHAFGDVSKANYSSLKSANVAWKARTEAAQWHVFIPQVCVPVWRRFATLAVLSGRVSTTVAEAMPVKHVCPAWPSLEPVKDSTANVQNLAAGLTTRRQLLGEMGEDIEEVDRILAEDQARAKSLGLVFGTLPQPANDNQPAAAAA